MISQGSEISINGKELELLETLLLNKNQIVTISKLTTPIRQKNKICSYNFNYYNSFGDNNENNCPISGYVLPRTGLLC